MEFAASLLTVVTSIVLVTWALSRLVHRRTSVRDFLWRSALLLILFSPVLIAGRAGLTAWQWSLPIWPVARNANPQSPSLQLPNNRPPVGQATIQQMHVPPSSMASTSTQKSNSNIDARSQSTDVAHPAQSADSNNRLISWFGLLAGTWSLGVVIQLGLLGLSLRNAILLYRSGQLISDQKYQALLQQCALQVGLKQAPRLATSSLVTSPIVIGLVRPRILIPTSLLNGDIQHDLRAIVLHECGHLKRCDLVYELLLRTVQAVFWFHPLIYLLACEIRRLREEMCDNFVLASESALNYAEILFRVAIGQQPDESLLLGIGVVSRMHRLESRIAGLLAAHRSIETTPPKIFRFAIYCVVCCSIIISLLTRITSARAEAPPLKQVSASSETEPKSSPSPLSTEEIHQLQREKLLEQLKAHPVEVSFQLVDTQDRPVVGAKVDPRGVSTLNGAFFDLSINGEKLWTSATSDAEGRVSFALPQEIVLACLTMQIGRNTPQAIQRFLNQPQTDSLHLFKQLGLRSINLRIDHPHHPLWWDSFIPRSNAKLNLSDSYTLIIRARREGETSLARRVVPWLAGTRSTDWSETDGILTYRRVSLTELDKRPLLRVVQLPEAGPAWFSEVVDLKHLAGNPIEINVTLQPGSRVAGRLSDNVPRPVRQGKVFGQIIHLVGKESHGSAWSVVSDIAEDGSFVLDSVPTHENLQLMAVCEGWSSLPSSLSEIEAYQTLHRFPREQTSTGSANVLMPHLLRVENVNLQNVIISMQETATCEITTVDENNRPLPGVLLNFSPNMLFWEWGSSLVGTVNDSTTLLREQLESGNHEFPSGTGKNASAFAAITNDEGVAVISGLPAAPPDVPEIQQFATFFATHKEYTTTTQGASSMSRLMDMSAQFAKLSPGQITKQTIRMKPISDKGPENLLEDSAADESVSTPQSRLEIGGRVEDEQGQPLAGVKVLFGGMDCFDIKTNTAGNFHHLFPAEMVEGADETESIPLQFVKPGYAPQFLEVSLGDRNLQIQLSQDTWIEGVVRKPDGSPAPNVPVRGYYQAVTSNDFGVDLPLKAETTTDAEGRYRLFVETAGYQLTAGNAETGIAWLPRNISKTPGDPTKFWIAPQEHRQVDIQLEPSARFHAEFLNSETGQPISGLYLYVEDAPNDDCPEAQETHKSDVSGKLVLSELPIGKHSVWISTNNYLRCFSESAVSEQKHSEKFTPTRNGLVFDFQPGMDPVRIYLEPGVEVSGLVLDPDGKPIPNSEVYLGNIADDVHSHSSPYYGQRTDKTGRFQLLLPSGGETTYRLLACSPNQPKWTTGVSQAFTAKLDKSVNPLEIRMAKPGIVRGRAVDEHGQPLASVAVHARHIDGLEKEKRLPMTTSKRDGTFELQGLRPGQYLLHGSQRPDGPFQNPSHPQTELLPGQTLQLGDVLILTGDLEE